MHKNADDFKSDIDAVEHKHDRTKKLGTLLALSMTFMVVLILILYTIYVFCCKYRHQVIKLIMPYKKNI